MEALTWQGTHDIRVDEVPRPTVEQPTDAVVEVSATAICGSDLHHYNGYLPGMEEGDIVGHETMGEVVEIGDAVTDLAVGDRVVVPFPISCGECWFCKQGLFALCDTSNPNESWARAEMGHSPAGLFGYSHLLGGFDGGQAEYLRVPYANVGPIQVDDALEDAEVLFLSDIFPTGYMAAENADIQSGETVAVWGAGPVGQFAIQSAWLFGADRVIAIDLVPDRLVMARDHGDAEIINLEHTDVYDRLMAMTDGRGPDRCIDAVGTEAHGTGLASVTDQVKQRVGLEDDRPYVLRETIQCCRKGGTISVPGVYLGSVDNIPFGAAMNKGLTIETGQTHVQRYLEPLLEMIQDGQIDPSFVLTHVGDLDDGPALYETFNEKRDGCVKAMLRP